jgi:hypothetical protein
VRLLTISVVVVFLYGGMVWGMFPINPDVSWEGHLWGAVSGFILALYYRKYIIRRDKFDWEEEDGEEDADNMQTPPETATENQPAGDEKKGEQKQVEKLGETSKKPNNVSHTGEFYGKDDI